MGDFPSLRVPSLAKLTAKAAQKRSSTKNTQSPGENPSDAPSKQL